jgi:SAM-dependent methyltransferase
MRDEIFERQAALEDRHWWFTGRRAILRAITHRLLPPHAGGTLLDVGCGTGGNLGALAPGYRAAGLEPSPVAIQIARQRFPSVTFVQGDDPALLRPFARTPCHVLLNDVLEHVPDDFLLFSRLVALLPVGATVLLTVPAETALWSPHDLALSHYRRYSVDRLRRVWKGLPVRERLVSPCNSRLYPFARLHRAVAAWRALGGPGGEADLALPIAPVNRLLAAVFASEQRRLLRSLGGDGRPAFWRGVSLLAVLERLPGALVPRGRPPDVPADPHPPVPG